MNLALVRKKFAKIFSSAFLIMSISTQLHAQTSTTQQECDAITYEKLAQDPWTDHVVCFQELFSQTHITSFLEFGLGRATKYFLDNCESVTSIELSVEDRASRIEPWFWYSTSLF